MITQNRLKELLHYDPVTGIWTWKVIRTGYAYIGSQAGNITKHGYRNIRVDGKLYRSSRLVYLYMKNEWPSEEIDHIDRNRSNDKWDNLRKADSCQNSYNRGVRTDNSTGHKGICRHKTTQKYQVNIGVNKKFLYLGSFDTLDEAIKVRKEAELKYHGEYRI